MSSFARFPGYARFCFILLSLVLLIGIIYIGQQIFIPVLLSLLFAILLRPVVAFLSRRLKFPHVIAALTSVLLFILLIVLIASFVFWQISDLADDWNKIKLNLRVHYHHLQEWVRLRLHVSYIEQRQYLEATQSSLTSGQKLGNTLSSFSDVLVNLILVPIYVFLFLIYRNLLLTFLSKLFGPNHQLKLQHVLYQVKIAIQSFLVGLLIEMGIVSALTSIGLMIIGVEYALLLGVITGLLNLIPYIGIMVAAMLSIFASLTSSTDLHTIIGVIAVNVIVQLLDNNILVPLIVSSKVKINALVSIIGIVVGGALAGVSGMFLAIPSIAIMKVIFDRVQGFEPWGFLMGDDLPKTVEWGKIKFPSLNAGETETKEKEGGKPD
ncbi:MAG: AI-2E family transporter [Bacteroidia bacterium]